MRTLPESPAWLDTKVSPDSTSGVDADEELEAVLVPGLSTAAIHCHVGVGSWEGAHLFECRVQRADVSLLSSQGVSVPSLETLPGVGNLAVFGLHSPFPSTPIAQRVHGSLSESLSLGSLKC